jgi:hypothetical protein
MIANDEQASPHQQRRGVREARHHTERSTSHDYGCRPTAAEVPLHKESERVF